MAVRKSKECAGLTGALNIELYCLAPRMFGSRRFPVEPTVGSVAAAVQARVARRVLRECAAADNRDCERSR